MLYSNARNQDHCKRKQSYLFVSLGDRYYFNSRDDGYYYCRYGFLTTVLE